jgi:Zn-dependent protease with chaperone function
VAVIQVKQEAVMFTNIIYFILALLIFQTGSLGSALGSFPRWQNGILILLLFGLEARRRFLQLFRQARGGALQVFSWQMQYRQTHNILMVLSLLAFSAEVYLFNFKSLLGLIPGTRSFSSWEGLLGISFYGLHLLLIWYFGYPSFKLFFQSPLQRRPYLRSQLQFNLPILFPWFLITLVTDLLDLFSLPSWKGFLNHPLGEVAYILAFLFILSIFFPFLVKKWWQCRPIPEGPKKEALLIFCREIGQPFREILLWPTFEGRMLTAGVMGLVKRFRYLLITPSLLEILDPEELEAVVAHEFGHIRKRHLLFYLFFFGGYALLAVFFSQFITYLVLRHPAWLEFIPSSLAASEELLSLIMIIPLALGLVLYFRFLFGFFMRNFERQADLFALALVQSPQPLVRSLEKISLYSGQSRDLPSWHHFSIAQRIEFLERTYRNPRLAKGHQRKIMASVGVYFLLLLALGVFGLTNRTLLHPGLMKDPQALESWLATELKASANDPKVLMALAVIYQDQKQLALARNFYERLLEKEPNQVLALNNLAWLLATSRDPALFQPQKALSLAQKAAGLKPEPMILDTLAEAYWVNGQPEKALQIIQQVLDQGPANRSYYEGQKEKFKKPRQ